MKTASFLVAFVVLAGGAHAQDSTPSDAASPRIFSTEALSAEVSRLQRNGTSAQREPAFTKEKLMRPPVLAGLGLMAIGGILAATAGESATITMVNPATGQPFSSTVSVTQTGRRWTSFTLLGGGGVLTYLGLKD
jgi:hypothetical protein